MEYIATLAIVGIRPDGERIDITVSIGRPYQKEGGPVEQWRCPVSVVPIDGALPDMAGTDAVQSMCMALSIALSRLGHFVEAGGTLQNDDGTEFSLESYSFGFGGSGYAQQGVQGPTSPPSAGPRP